MASSGEEAFGRLSFFEGKKMFPFLLKTGLAGFLIAAASTCAKRYPGFGALIASLPLVSILGMIFLWWDKPDKTNMAAHSEATFWYVLPSLPMFLIMPVLLRRGCPFWVSLVIGCGVTIILYTGVVWAGRRYGLPL